jgi:uncharacterized membrane protein
MTVRFPIWLNRILMLLVVVGILFRFVNLDYKVYWHDEVYTSLRAAGYTRWEIDQELFQNKEIAVGTLQRFQQIKPGSTIADTVHSLAKEDPQHPPLYFAMARGWLKMFGSSMTASRLLPALLSLLGLPLMYALAWELFASHEIALLATTFLALSPFDVLFAQTARQYSLLTVLVIGSQWLLLRAIRRDAKEHKNGNARTQKTWSSWQNWGLYTLSVVVGLYTHPFFALTVIGQAAYLGLEVLFNKSDWIAFGRKTQLKPGISVRNFCFAIATALILYSPWLSVIVTNRQRALATTDWARFSPGIGYLIEQWTLSFTSLFFDLYSSDNVVGTFLGRAPIMLLILVSIYAVCRRCDRSTALFVGTFILVPFLLLALPDLMQGGKRSAVSRYLISCYPGIQLAVSYFIATKLAVRTQYSNRRGRQVKTFQQCVRILWQRALSFPQRFSTPNSYTLHTASPFPFSRWFWCGVLTLLVTGSVVSLGVSAVADSWWSKDLSIPNPQVARLVSKSSPAIVISDIGDDYTNTGDIISLSYLLDKSTPFLMVNRDEVDWVRTEGFRSKIQGLNAFAYRPTNNLRQTLEKTYGPMKRLLSERLWLLRQN